jgi:diaminohydroxyphosphoribosylaminopyrimidine deaminase/5-amino-6-(5-phosphoribosylamino)uracil reductase
MKRNQRRRDGEFMSECLMLARRGAGYVSPNPMVGAVLVKHDRVIGRGYHRKFGGPHAEVYAIQSAKASPRGATLYVNLEPCNHYGKTPPCTDLIVASGIRRVVIGMNDPNPNVSGGGVHALRKSGIEVTTGILREECQRLNEAFLKFVTAGLPLVVLKVAQTLDGKIADANGASRWISNPASRTIVHQLRSEHDAVLVGAGTITADNPRLTVRDVRGRNPVRVVLDAHLSVPVTARVFANTRAARTILLTTRTAVRRHRVAVRSLIRRGVDIITLEPGRHGLIPLSRVLEFLASESITSVLVEGGAHTFSEFLRQGVADTLIAFVAPNILGKGLDAFAHLGISALSDAVSLHSLTCSTVAGDLMIVGRIQNNVRHPLWPYR